MTDARAAFGLLLELLAALEDGHVPRAKVCRWFVHGADRWARTASTKPLHEHLGLTRRLRRDYLLDRQRDHLNEALEAFVQTRTGSPWELAGAFVEELERFERRRGEAPGPGASRLTRALWLAFALGLPVPRSRKHWFLQLNAKHVDRSVTAHHADDDMDAAFHSQISDLARTQWAAANPHAPNYSERGQYVQDAISEALSIWTAAGSLEQARAQVNAWIATHFTAAEQSPGDRTVTTKPSAAIAATPDEIEAAARREFAASADLRDEFGDLETYIAYRKAQARGLIRMVGVRERGRG